jgi:O-antigen/teichoic acid export membrane protein
MRVVRQPFVRAVAALWIGQIAAQALTLASTLWLVNALGIAAFGRFAAAQAIAAYAALLASAGTDLWGTRAAATSAAFPIGAFLSLRLAAGAAAGAAVVGFSLAVPELRTDWLLVAILCVIFVPTALRLDWWLYGTSRGRSVAEATVLRAVVALGLVLILVRTPEDLGWAATAHVLAVLFGALATVRLGALRTATWRWRVDVGDLRSVAWGAAPLAGAVLAAQVYYSLDTVLLRVWRGEVEAGFYASAYKIIMMIIAMRHLLVQAVFPFLVRAAGRSELRGLVLTVQRIGALMGLPFVVVGVLWARPILVFVFGDSFAPVAGPFAVLLVMAGVVFVNLAWPQLLNAHHRSGAYLLTLVVGAVVNVVGNALLIPRYGMIGAAWATLAAEVSVMCAAIIACRGVLQLSLVSYLRPALIAAAVMLLTGWLLTDAPWPVALISAACVYVAVALIQRPIRPHDLASFLAARTPANA